MGVPFTGTRHFGIVSVNGRNRVPVPAARIMAFPGVEIDSDVIGYRRGRLAIFISPSRLAASFVKRSFDFRPDLTPETSCARKNAVDVSESRWYEIDDHRDLDAAKFLFLDRNAQFDRIQELHGSYWRYGFTDHSYLYNLHFPPQHMLDVWPSEAACRFGTSMDSPRSSCVPSAAIGRTSSRAVT